MYIFESFLPSVRNKFTYWVKIIVLIPVKVSNKLEYACRVLAHLARFHAQETLLHIDSLATSEAVPANYLVQILNELKSKGLIISKRGKQGGYALSRSPERIQLRDIVEAVDPELLDIEFSTEGESGKQVATVWNSIGKSFCNEVDAYTLDMLIPTDSSEMYYI